MYDFYILICHSHTWYRPLIVKKLVSNRFPKNKNLRPFFKTYVLICFSVAKMLHYIPFSICSPREAKHIVKTCGAFKTEQAVVLLNGIS